ncbi:MAG: small subunit ribosomal protein, partial [Acidimicrobiaceae bacterium]
MFVRLFAAARPRSGPLLPNPSKALPLSDQTPDLAAPEDAPDVTEEAPATPIDAVEEQTVEVAVEPEVIELAAQAQPAVVESAVAESAVVESAVVESGAEEQPEIEEPAYVNRQVIEDDLGGMSLEDAYAASMVEVEDGQIVEGTVVKVDRDEVLLDIGYKSEGVIPARELSIRNDVDPSEIVSMGDKIEALVLQKEDKEGRLLLSKKRAQYERAWGTIEKIKEEEGVVRGPVIEVVKGGLIIDIGLRGFLP